MHHRAGLARLTRETRDAEWLARLEADWRSADLDERGRALLTYAEQLTVAPSTVVEDDLVPLRTAGLSDRAILEANLVVAYFAYANRVADGLGVSLEDERASTEGD